MRAEAKSHKVRDRARGAALPRGVGQKVTIEVTIHDGMLDLRPNGAGGRAFKTRFMGKIWENLPPRKH
jgi:hypothetical protein